MPLVIHKIASEERIRVAAAYSAIVMALIPLFNYNVLGIGVFVFLGAGLVVLSPLIQHSMLLKGPLLAYILFTIYDLFTFAWAPGHPDINQYMKIIVYVLLIVTVAYHVREMRLMLRLQIVLGIIVVIVLCFTDATMVVQTEYLTDTYRAVLRIGDVQIDPNYASILFFPLSIYCVKGIIDKNRTYYKVLSIVLLTMCVFACLRSGTRGGLLSIVIGCGFYLLRSRVRVTKRLLLILVVTIVTCLYLPNLMELLPETLQRRFTLTMVLTSGSSGRVGIWKTCIDDIGNSVLSFLFGYGKGAVITNIGVASHNFFLDQIFNGGIIALILLVSFEVSLYKKAKANSNVYVMALLLENVCMSMTVSVGANIYFWTNIVLCMILSDASENELALQELRENQLVE